MSHCAQRKIPPLCLVLLWSSFAIGASAAEKIVWKPVEAAVLKIDNHPAKIWNVFLAEKKSYLILVQLGARFLLLDTKEHEIYELDPVRLERKGKELFLRKDDKVTAELEKTEGRASGARIDAPSERRALNLLSSADWQLRDVGRALRVSVRLVAEGRILEVQLPHSPDLRSLY